MKSKLIQSLKKLAVVVLISLMSLNVLASNLECFNPDYGFKSLKFHDSFDKAKAYLGEPE